MIAGGPVKRVENTDDVRRVLGLPRRGPPEADLIDGLTRAFALDDDSRLRPQQAVALREMYELGGLFAPMRVGSGKTLVTLLLPTLLNAQRPVLMVPASLRNKTRKEFCEYRQNWRVRLPRLVSYEEMGRPDRETKLAELAPDLLICDEAHRLKNPFAAVTRRVGRAIELLRPRVAMLSGTLITDALMDYWHLLCWALGHHAPVPLKHAEAQTWAQALDRDTGNLDRIGLGALEHMRGGFHEHMRETRGVVPTPGKDCDASIEISEWSPKIPAELKHQIDMTAATRERPDGELLEDMEVSDCLCQLALGFYYTWDPLPPEWWLLPRRRWNAYVRQVLTYQIEGFDSPSMVVNALDHPKAMRQPPNAAVGKALLDQWRTVRDRYEPNVVPVWLDDTPIKQVAKRSGLIWTRYRAVGERLRQYGMPYYPGGTDPQTAKPGSPIALSISAHSTGRNLQAWSENTILTPMANAGAYEQLIGRTHRAGQLSDTVYVSVYTVIDYHRAVMGRVRTQARATSQASGFSQKLTDATWT